MMKNDEKKRWKKKDEQLMVKMGEDGGKLGKMVKNRIKMMKKRIKMMRNR